MDSSNVFFSKFKAKLIQLLFTSFRLILTVFVIALSPMLAFAFGLIILYRLLVGKVAKYFDPTLGKMMSSMSSIFSAHNVYGNAFALSIAFHIAGHIGRSDVIRVFEKMFQNNLTPNGQHVYEEMKQKVVSKFGFCFWKSLENFKVEDHIHYYHPKLDLGNPSDVDYDSIVTLQDVHNTIAKFGKTPLNPSLSPWAVYVIKNFKSDINPSVKSAVIFRLHHCMFDGYAVFNLFNKLCDDGPLVLEGQSSWPDPPSRKWERWLQLCVKALLLLIVGPYFLVGQLLRTDRNELVKINKRNFKSVMRFGDCPPIKLSDLKLIKNHYKVSLFTVTTTIMATALKRLLDKKGSNPDKVHMIFPLPAMKEHPDKLRNYFTGGVISLDMKISDRTLLVETVQRKFREFRNVLAVGLPEASMILLRVLGSLPNFLVPNIDNSSISTTMMYSSFPGPVGKGYVCGFPVVDSTVAGSTTKPCPVASICYSYNGFYKFSVVGDASVFVTQKEIDEFGEDIFKAFTTFLRSVQEAQV